MNDLFRRTLRDRFAGHALAGYLASNSWADMAPDNAAGVAYRIADAMLRQRNRLDGLPAPRLLTADCVIFDSEDRLLLIRRANEPFKEMYALPGGFVDEGESTEVAARRELNEEAGISAGKLWLVDVFCDPGRDPRGPTVSIAYAAVVADKALKAGSDAAAAEWVEDWRSVELAFDHRAIVTAARNKLIEMGHVVE